MKFNYSYGVLELFNGPHDGKKVTAAYPYPTVCRLGDNYRLWLSAPRIGPPYYSYRYLPDD